MRLDEFLATVGVLKRRSKAKELSQNGLVEVNGRTVKPAFRVKQNDIIRIKGISPRVIEVLRLPSGSISKEKRSNYIRDIASERSG